MVKKPKDSEDKKNRKTKIKAIAIEINNAEVGDVIAPTRLCELIKLRDPEIRIHKDTITDIFDAHETLKDLPFERLEKDGEFAGIKRIKDYEPNNPIEKISRDIQLIKKKFEIKD